MKRECMECGESILGRIDKKFCSDLCRNSYNNKINSLNNNYVRNVNMMLRRNRKILEELTPSKSAKTTRTQLLQKGFNFHYYTNTYRTPKGADYFFCYDYGYLPLKKDTFMLLKRDEKRR